MSIALHGVAKSFGDRKLFSELDMQIAPGERAALIGRNGSGKSTLLRIIAGLEQPDAGSVDVRGTVALLGQAPPSGPGTVADLVTPPGLRAAAAALEVAQNRLAEPTPEHLETYAAAEERFGQLGGYDFDVRMGMVLDGLGLRADAPAERLSGGETRRAMLAALLLAPADVLLLDEPTNHLDVEGRVWLEEWLRESPATVLLVSHDRAFLDAAVTRVFELERGGLAAYAGNYTEAMALKRTARAAHERDYRAQERKKGQLTQEMHRLGSMGRSAGQFNHKRAGNTSLLLAKGKAESASVTLARRARALARRIERLDEVEKPYDDRLTVNVPLPEVPTGPGEVLTLQDVSVVRGGRELLSGLNLVLRRGDKVALIGPNGCGKSSLLARLFSEAAGAGEARFGHGLSVFRAGQHGEELEEFATMEEAISAAQPAMRRQDLHHLLGQLGLPGEPDFPVARLSGGQHTRLALARLAVTRASLLVLDEPSNNLDLEAVEALEDLLVAWPGSLLFTSHDRRLVERVADRVWLCAEGRVVAVDE